MPYTFKNYNWAYCALKTLDDMWQYVMDNGQLSIKFERLEDIQIQVESNTLSDKKYKEHLCDATIKYCKVYNNKGVYIGDSVDNKFYGNYCIIKSVNKYKIVDKNGNFVPGEYSDVRDIVDGCAIVTNQSAYCSNRKWFIIDSNGKTIYDDYNVISMHNYHNNGTLIVTDSNKKTNPLRTITKNNEFIGESFYNVKEYFGEVCFCEVDDETSYKPVLHQVAINKNGRFIINYYNVSKEDLKLLFEQSPEYEEDYINFLNFNKKSN